MGFVECVSKWATFALGFQWGTSAEKYSPQFSSIEPRAISTAVERSTHQLPHDPSFCNTPQNRQCWLDGFNIYTDLDQKWPETGVTREFWLDVAYGDVAPDGFTKRAQLINGTYPGPLIEANWGDNLVIHVTNHLSLPGQPEYDNGTTIHWHGFRQLGSNEADGVNGVTQCPIAPGGSYTYKFQATQHGHSWYHSHYALQYPNGVYGPLLIHGPTSANWDADMGVITISDWLHPNAYVVFSVGELQGIGGRASNSTVINGKGIFPCQATDADPSTNCSGRGGSRFETVVQKGKRYLMRLVNTSADMQFLFSIDNHMLEVIAADFVPIQPYMTESISIGIGQRYTVVVTANPNSTAPFPPAPTDGNFWIRTIPLEDCGDLVAGYWPTYGIMRYANQTNFNSSGTALTDPVSKPYGLQYYTADTVPECVDENPADSHPIVPWTVGNPADSEDLKVGVDLNGTHGFIRWQVGGEPMWLDWANPTISNLDNTTWNPEYDVLVENSGEEEWVYFVIQGDFNNATTPGLAPVPAAAHPMHLHGHDFAILAQGFGRWDELDPKPALNLNNPLRRDVALLPNLGYLVIAFKTDNPGIWLMHCHIAWHASSGLALQVVERQSEIAATIQDEEQINDTCAAWVDYTQEVVIFQDDSGI